MSKDRLEAFSDGVFAVAITILIFNVQLPATIPAGHLWAELGGLWPSYSAYVASFLTIGVMWINHHAMFRRLAGIDRTLQFLNLVLLMAVVFVPFPTSLLGRYIPGGGADARSAATLYAVSAIIVGISFSALWGYVVSRPRLLVQGLDAGAIRRRLPYFAIGSAVYVSCLAIAQVSPIAVVVLCAATAAYYLWDQIPEPAPASSPGTPPGMGLL